MVSPFGTNVILAYFNANAATWVSSTNPLTVTITGYPVVSGAAGASPITQSVTFSSNALGATGNTINVGTQFYNVTAIQLQGRALPGTFAVYVITNSITSGDQGNGVLLAQLTNEGTSGELLYSVPGQAYLSTQVGTTAVQYNQQNGQGTTPFTLTGDSSAHALGVTGQLQYYYYTLNELAVSTNTQAQDELAFGIYNSTAGVGQSNQFQLNYSYGGTKNNMSYVSTQETLASSPINVHTGFRTEKGSEVASVTPTSLTLDMAKAQDYLQFVVGPSNTSVTTTKHIVGPIGIGQSVPGLTNVTVSNVTATCTGGTSASASCTITGVGNLTATPSVTQAVTSVGLNTATTPLAVLDANANNASTLILVGSKYVNTVSAQVFAQNPSLDSSFGPGSVVVQAFGQNRILVAGYTAAQTVSAGNQFINDLLTAASTP